MKSIINIACCCHEDGYYRSIDDLTHFRLCFFISPFLMERRDPFEKENQIIRLHIA